MVNIVKLILGYSTVLLPQLYIALQQYQAQHPNPELALALSMVGAILLHGANPPKATK